MTQFTMHLFDALTTDPSAWDELFLHCPCCKLLGLLVHHDLVSHLSCCTAFGRFKHFCFADTLQLTFSHSATPQDWKIRARTERARWGRGEIVDPYLADTFSIMYPKGEGALGEFNMLFKRNHPASKVSGSDCKHVPTKATRSHLQSQCSSFYP